MNREESEKYFLKEFILEKYTGKWYEIARIENSFEKGMNSVTAEYSIDGDTVRVVNRGYKVKKREWKESKAVAKLKFQDTQNILRVSFFRPFYADYIVLDYDREGYSWALVRSSSRKYFWILSRTPHMGIDLYEQLIERAVRDGFMRDQIMKTDQEMNIDTDR